MAGDQDVRRAAHLRGDARLLRAGDQVVDEHADAALRSGAERARVLGQVVDAVERFDDDAFDPQVVAPDPFEQRGVVHALDPDAALAGDPRLRAGDRVRTRRRLGARPSRRGRAAGTDERHRAAVEQEGRRQHRELAPRAVAVLEHDGVALLAAVDGAADGDHRAAEPSVGGLDDEVDLGRHFGTTRRRARLGQHIVAVTHCRTLGGAAARRLPGAPSKFDSVSSAMPSTAPGGPVIDEHGVVFVLADRYRRLAGVRLEQDLGLGGVAFTRERTQWWLQVPRPPVDRMEYLFEVEDANGHRTTITDPANPLRAPGAFGDKSVLEFPDYVAPAWLSAPGAAGSDRDIEVDAPLLDGAITGSLWTPDVLDEAEPAPLLVVHDGPEFAVLGGFVHYLAAMIAAGELPPVRAALLVARRAQRVVLGES